MLRSADVQHESAFGIDPGQNIIGLNDHRLGSGGFRTQAEQVGNGGRFNIQAGQFVGLNGGRELFSHW